ncbi:MAG: SLC13 family permease [Planctomycetota bacterium]|jgi:di/tricarboxylate transporter
MDPQAWIAVGTLAVAVTLFISKWIPLEATALGIPVVLAVTGTLEPALCLKGFGNQAVIALAGIFILGAGLQESGVATLVARGLERMGGRSETRAILVLMVAVAVLSAFMSNAATVAVFLPAVAVLSRRTGLAATRLMMPLAFAAILGGTLTLIGTTPNLILGNDLRLRTGEGLGMFEFAVVGAPVTAVGIAFMALVGWRMLPRRERQERLRAAPLPEELAQSYGFTKNLYRMKVLEPSGVAGQSIAEARVGKEYDLDILLVLRGSGMGQRTLHPQPDLVLEPGDQIYLEGEAKAAWRLAEEQTLQFDVAGDEELDRILGRGVTLAEVTLSPRCGVLGKTFTELQFRSRYGLNVISLWRGDKAITAGTREIPLQLGDAFLVSGAPAKVRELARDPDYVVLGDGAAAAEDVRRAPLAILLLLLAILPPLLGWMPLPISALAGALLMVFTGCLSVGGARRSVDFTILFLIIGTIPLGIALDQSGVAAKVARSILVFQTQLGDAGLLGALFLISAALSTTSNNGAAAVILAPVAAEVARAAGLDLGRAFLAVAYGASCAFVLPFAHQCNLMVMGPAGYATRDFVRVGVVLSVLMTVSAVVLLAL